MDWPAVDVHGFVSQGYLYTTGNTFIEQSEDGTFAYNEIGINIGSQVTDQLRIGAQIFAYELGDYGNNTLIVDWAYADYRHNDAFGLRLGRYKLPLGMYGEMLDLDLAFTAVLMPQAVYDARYRELYGGLNGAQMYGILPLGAGGNLEYQAFVGTMNIENDGYLADQFTQGPNALSNVESIEIGTTYGATLNWRPPLPGLRLHFSSLISNDLDVSGNVSVAVPNPPLTFTFDLPTTSHVKISPSSRSAVNIAPIGSRSLLNIGFSKAAWISRSIPPPSAAASSGRIRIFTVMAGTSWPPTDSTTPGRSVRITASISAIAMTVMATAMPEPGPGPTARARLAEGSCPDGALGCQSILDREIGRPLS